jgi:hypothetical protein
MGVILKSTGFERDMKRKCARETERGREQVIESPSSREAIKILS